MTWWQTRAPTRIECRGLRCTRSRPSLMLRGGFESKEAGLFDHSCGLILHRSIPGPAPPLLLGLAQYRRPAGRVHGVQIFLRRPARSSAGLQGGSWHSERADCLT
jgi:hypothetical protein